MRVRKKPMYIDHVGCISTEDSNSKIHFWVGKWSPRSHFQTRFDWTERLRLQLQTYTLKGSMNIVLSTLNSYHILGVFPPWSATSIWLFWKKSFPFISPRTLCCSCLNMNAPVEGLWLVPVNGLYTSKLGITKNKAWKKIKECQR